MAKPILCIVGGETLRGRDVRDVLAERRAPFEVRLLGEGEQNDRVLTLQEDDAIAMERLELEFLRDADVVVLAGAAEASRLTLELLADEATRPALIDLTHGLEDQPDARLRAPLVEPPGYEVPGEAIHVVAHPAALALALLLTRLHAAHPVRRVVAQILEPASERGRAGIDELQRQTAALLSFTPLPKAIYDAQVAFNLLPRLGDEAVTALAETEQRVERHLASLLAQVPGGVPMPSLRVAQAPVFHGHSMSLWIEFADRPTPVALAESLGSDRIDVRTADTEPPSNVGVAGQAGITIGSIEPDRNDPRALWLWLAADNYRLPAESAAALIEEVFPT